MKSADTNPALPEDVEVKIYGKKFCPSNNAVDAFPNTEESSDPDTISMRSFSIMLLLVWVSCRGRRAAYNSRAASTAEVVTGGGSGHSASVLAF